MLATVPSHTSDDATWAKAESAFRLWSFRVYYERSYADEMDPTLRFALAIVASSQEIKDREKVLTWYADYMACQRKRNSNRHFAPRFMVPAIGECGKTAGHGVSPFPPAVGLTAGGGITQAEDRQ
jgi:hypothetical protein